MSSNATALREHVEAALDARVEGFGLSQLFESPLNPRTSFDPEALKELTASVLEKGVIEPLVVRPSTDKKHTTPGLEMFEIICGARRFRAAKAAGLTHVLAVVRAYTDVQAIEIMAIENGQRASVPPLEEAAGYKQLLLIDKTYTAAMIAKKIGHDERYVWNRLRLLELIPEAELLLRSGLIGVEHAEVLAKLKESDQKRAISRQNGGLFASDTALEFDDRPRLGSSAYNRVKPVSVRELKQWVAEHVRLDLKFAAKAAPLDFGESAQRVAAAEAADVRGKTPVPIVFSHMCPYNAADAKERTYGASAWKKAEGKEGQPTCDFARLGVVVAGEHYGESFHVCINRDKCLVHWKDSVKAKQKANELRAKGQTKKAAKVEKRQEESDTKRWERERRERAEREAAWTALCAHLWPDVVSQVKVMKVLTPAQAAYMTDGADMGFNRRDLERDLGKTWFKYPVAALLLTAAAPDYADDFNDYVKTVAKPLGLDIKRLTAVRDKHTPKVDTPAAKKKAS